MRKADTKDRRPNLPARVFRALRARVFRVAPARAFGALPACLAVALACGAPVWAQTENLLDRISNQRMLNFEGRLTDGINAALSRYVSHTQYVLSVKVIWNRDIIPAVQAPGLSPSRQKLPGFPIFVNSPGAGLEDETTPPFVRLVVKVLLDETLPEFYERFVRKVVPIVARFDAGRGDQVIVLKETFPVKPKEEGEAVPTLPEKELMEKLQETAGQPLAPPSAQPQIAAAGGDPAEAAQIAYEEGRFSDALRIVQTAFQRARNNQERSKFVGMEGSVLYTMQDKSAARASWQRALVFDPGNLEVQKVMRFFETTQPETNRPGSAQ